jgi:hypothetical protein
LAVGEIGLSRREFLYEIKFWELRRIIKGYRKRDIPKLQMMRMCAYWACYSMRDPEGMDPMKFLPLSFDKEYEDEDEMEAEDQDDLLATIEDVNTQNEDTKE